ncbi:glycosyltransferase family 4 protein [Solwaraspora sp. WMMD937]|uniref:glycosyltransferase family 4 protein n=1 Tax=Solwaraspora sp. WMMD937 TaxID=3016090 RepID=UPI00249BD0D9|nr:glycosyltransferase family 4 protein [Solwaraspora sp. WMMD937]WFE22574.1 glycosyltransferase family 4 protein [Solwaraspora sp. WMMD937]
MRVVVAHNRYRQAQPSGENVIVDSEIDQLAAAGVEVIPFLRSSDDIPALPATGKALLPISPSYAPAAQRDLDRLLTEHRPDVLHLHNPYPLISPWAIRTAHRHRVPVVHTVHNYRQVCSAGLYFRDGRICTDCRGRAIGLPGVVHRCYRGSRAQSAVMAATLALHRPTWRSVDRFIALTSAVAGHLRDYGVPDERIVVKPNAIADPGPPAPLGDGFLFLGRLTPEKGIGLLLDAWQRHPDGALGTLRIGGDGELRPLVASAAAGRTDIDFLGPLDRSAVRDALRTSAVVLAVSTWHDVLPTVVIEALASGRPVLGTALGGIPYLVGADTGTAGTGTAGTGAAGPAGWVVPPEAAALSAALPVARDGAAALAGVARTRYETTFHPDVVMKQHLAVYDAVATRIS